MGFLTDVVIPSLAIVCVVVLIWASLDSLNQYFYIWDRPKSQVGRYLHTTIERTDNEIPGGLRNSEQSKSDDSRDGEVSCYS